MKLAVIDLGTNSIRYDAFELSLTGEFICLYRRKIMVRLGDRVYSTGKLCPKAVARTIKALEGFRKISDRLGIKRTVAVATSALREASDSASFLAEAKRRSGFQIQVISGSREARLIATGVLANEDNLGRSTALLDIGGGSTEVSYCDGQTVLESVSLPLGTARLKQLFLRKTAPDPKGVEALRQHVRQILEKRVRKFTLPLPQALLGSSGTAKAVSKILKNSTGSAIIRLEALDQLITRLGAMSRRELLLVPGLKAKRVAMIVPGAIILVESMRALGFQELRPTSFALRDGLLHEERRRLQKRLGELNLRLLEFQAAPVAAEVA